MFVYDQGWFFDIKLFEDQFLLLSQLGQLNALFLVDGILARLQPAHFKVDGYPKDPQFVVMQYEGPSTGAELSPIVKSQFVIIWKYPNPFKETADGQYLRAALAGALGIGAIVSH